MIMRSKEDIKVSVNKWDRGAHPLTAQDRVDVTHAIWALQGGLRIGDDMFAREFDDVIHRLVSLWYMGKYHEKLRGGDQIFKRDGA